MCPTLTGLLFWLSLLSAVLLLWYLDHQKLSEQLSVVNRNSSPSWSIDQITGAPNTTGFGDISTAWASSTPDGREEWVVVEFPYTVTASGVEIYETYNPGAVSRIASVAMDGSETTLWEGTDPTVGPGGVAKLQFSAPERTRRLKIVLDSARFPGWNELDAVGLIDRRGNRQWVSNAWASSSYGRNRELPTWFWP